MLMEIPNDVARRLQDLAAERGCTVGEILRKWVAAEAKKSEPESGRDSLTERAKNPNHQQVPKTNSISTLHRRGRWRLWH